MGLELKVKDVVTEPLQKSSQWYTQDNENVPLIMLPEGLTITKDQVGYKCRVDELEYWRFQKDMHQYKFGKSKPMKDPPIPLEKTVSHFFVQRRLSLNHYKENEYYAPQLMGFVYVGTSESEISYLSRLAVSLVQKENDFEDYITVSYSLGSLFAHRAGLMDLRKEHNLMCTTPKIKDVTYQYDIHPYYSY